MAEAVVDHLEVVEVEEQHRRVALQRVVGERAAEPVDEEQPVGQPGQRVVDRLVGEALAVASARGDVLDLVHHVHRGARPSRARATR